MVTFNAGNNSPTYGGVYVIGIRNNHLYSGRASYNHLEIMERNMLDANPTPTTLFEVEDYIVSMCCSCYAIFGMSDCKNYIFALCFNNIHQDSHYKLFCFDLNEKIFNKLNLWIPNYMVSPCECHDSSLKVLKNGNFLITNKRSHVINRMIYYEIKLEDGYFRMSQSRRDITIYGANDRSRGIPIVCLDDSASKWILLDCDGKVFFIQKNEGKQLIPSEGCDEIFLKCHSKYSMNHTQTLFIDYGRIYLLRSSHEHDLYEIEINEKHFTFKAIRIGRIDDMHTDVHHKILVTNEMAISVFQDICMYGFFRVPRLGELAFIKIQKMLSKKFKGDDCGRFEAYKGGISEEGLKKMIGLDAGKSLLPLLG